MIVPAEHPGRQERSATIAVAALTTIGLVLRLIVGHQSLFADELSTFWIVTAHGPADVLSVVHSDAEITPPLSFALSWLTTQFGHSPLLVRTPSLLAGVATIPIVYGVGLRTVGRPAALLAVALTTLSPFMIYYSAEARAYGLMMAFLYGSTLAMLLAVDTGRRRWSVLYASCVSAAVYSHYTCIFALAAQALWLLWAHPEHRRAALLATLSAVVAFLPWTTGLINDFTSPTSKILSALSPFTLHDVRIILQQWAVGYPYSTLTLRELPGRVGLAAIVAALMIAAIGAIAGARERAHSASGGPLAGLNRRLLLVGGIAVSVPLGEAIASLISTNLFGVRNLAAAWPATALVFSALVMAAGPRLRYVAATLAVCGFAVGAVKVVQPRYQRPDFRAAAAFIDDRAEAGDVIVDETAELSPGPYSPMDLTLGGELRVFRVGAPQQRDHPFNIFDAEQPIPETIAEAVAAARGRPIYYVSYLRPVRFPAPYRIVESRRFPSFFGLDVRKYAARPS